MMQSLALLQHLSTWVPVLTTSFLFAGEAFGSIVVIASTLSPCGFKIGFAGVFRKEGVANAKVNWQ